MGLIPENELSKQAGVELDPVTRGPMLDDTFMTNVPGIFASGNVSIVFDLVDYVSESGELAARGACAWLDAGCPDERPHLPVTTAGNVGACVPQRVQVGDGPRDLRFFCRVQHPAERVELRVVAGGVILARKRLVAVAPASMLSLEARVPAGAAPTLEIVEVG